MNLGSFSSIIERARTVVQSTSRYMVRTHLYDGTFLFLPFQRKKAIPSSTADLLHTVTEGEVGKLDNIAWHYYGTPDLWWVIAMANGILNPLRVTPGTVLRIPSMDIVYRDVLR